MTFTSIPVVDVHALVSGDETGRDAVVAELGAPHGRSASRRSSDTVSIPSSSAD